MGQIVWGAAVRPRVLVGGLLTAGVVVMLGGAGLQMVEPQLGLMAQAGLDGTVFGLAAKLGGTLALAGLVASALRRVTPGEGGDKALPPDEPFAHIAPLPPLRAARAAAALKRSRARKVA